jgi:hypothetical protein
MPDNDLLLSQLPDQLSSVVRPVPDFNRQLLQQSIARIASNRLGLREQLILSNFGYDFNFFVVKGTTGNVLIFKRKKKSEEVVVDVNLSFSLQPSLDRWVTRQLENLPTVFIWDLPPFISRDIESAVRICPPTAGIDRRAAIGLLSREEESLLVHFKNEEEVWFKGQEVKKIGGGLWEAAPFFVIYEGIRTWLKKEWPEKDTGQLNLMDENDVAQIVRTVALSFGEARRALAVDDHPAEEEEDRPVWLPFHYAIKDYRANILLRLDEEGQVVLNQKDSSGRSFQLGLEVAVQAKEHYNEARIRMNIPDFLISGDLSDAFWNIFLEAEEAEACRRDLLEKLNQEGHSLNPDQLLDILREGKTGNGTVFRIDRKVRTDINLFIASKEMEGQTHTIVFSGKFLVESVRTAKVSYRKNLKVLYQPEKNHIDKDVVAYFLRLSKYFKNWMDFLQ